MSAGSWLYQKGSTVATVTAGWTAKHFEEVLFDWVLYPAVIAVSVRVLGLILGTAVGFVIMTTLSITLCLLYIRGYDWAKVDMFGFEGIKKIQDKFGWRHVSNVIAFFYLSIWRDPFMTTIYLRKGSGQFNGMSPRDWKIFWSSVLVSNGAWTIGLSGLIQFALYLKHLI